MIYSTIKILKNRWICSKECSIKEIINYIKTAGRLRDTQIEAIEVYLFLKIKGDNKPLWQLFSEGFFVDESDFDFIEKALYEKNETQRLALYNFAKKELPSLAQAIQKMQDIDYDSIIKKIFYNIDYSDYLLSLPMGAP